MYQPVADIAYSESRISLHSLKLKVAKMFVDLGSTENITNTIDDKISHRIIIKKKINAFRKLDKYLWSQDRVPIDTMLKYYNT